MDSQLVDCILASVSPNVTPANRQAALNTYNSYKENPQALGLALSLCRAHQADEIRHGALLLVEHWVKLYWNNLSSEERNLLKKESLALLEGTKDIVVEALLVKQGLCRVVVEIAKREWPQQWPDLLPCLFAIADRGMTQVELTLLILLRIAEDVVQLKTLETAPRRRKDIYQELTENIPNLFNFFFKILNSYYSLQTTDNNVLMARVRLLSTLLTTLTCYVEFVQLKEFLLEEVFRMLCFLLNDKQLRSLAANCLSEISSRKFKGTELEQLVAKFLQPEIMSEILRSAAGSLTSESKEDQAFLLGLCETLAGISRQLSQFVLATQTQFNFPQTFVDLVQAVIQLCQHPSCVIAKVAVSAVTSLMRIQQKDSSKIVYPESLWTNLSQMVLQRLKMNTYYQSVWDFEDEADFKRAYLTFKCELCDLLRITSNIHPHTVLTCGLNRVSELVRSSVYDEEDWTAVHKFLDTASSTMLREKLYIEPMKPQLAASFDQLIALNPPTLSSRSQCASVIVTIQQLILEDDVRLTLILKHLFAMSGYHEAEWSNEIRDFRKHGLASLVRLCLDHGAQVVKHFDAIKSTIAQNLQAADVGNFERQHYIESLAILLNHRGDPVEQKALLEQLLCNDVTFLCTDPDFQAALANAESFASYLGLRDSGEDLGGRRTSLYSHILIVTGVLKRCQAVDGKHVAFDIISQTCLTPILKVVWLFKEIFALKSLQPDIIQSIVAVCDSEKNVLFGDNLPSCDFPAPKIPAVQAYVMNLQEALSQFVTALFFRPEFYSLRADMGSIILNGMKNLPNIKMRAYLHYVVRAFVKNCPENLMVLQLSSTFIPLMSDLFSYLDGKWQTLSADEEDVTLAELIDDRVTHQMSRDLVEVVSHFVLDVGKTVKVNEDCNAETVLAISTPGGQLLADPIGSQCAITIAFTALRWGDSQTSLKAIPLCSAIAFYVTDKKLLNTELCLLMYKSLLYSLRVHGDNEAQLPLLLSLGVLVYKWLASSVLEPMRQLMMEVGCERELLSKFEETLTTATAARKRKDLFRALVDHLIGKSTCHEGKEQVYIQNLMPLYKMPKHSAPQTEEVVSLSDLFER